MTLPYSFGSGTTADQNFFKQLQADLAAAEAAFTALVPQLAKAWASVTLVGAVPTVQASHNVTSVTSITDPGIFRVTVTTPFSSINWVPMALSRQPSWPRTDVALTTTTVDLNFFNGAALVNPAQFFFVGFGTQ